MSTYIHQFIKMNIIMGADKQPDEEVHRARSTSVPNAVASVPMELGCPTLPACGCIYQPTNPSNIFVQEFLQSLISRFSRPFSSSQRLGGGAEDSKFLITCLVTCPTLRLSRVPPCHFISMNSDVLKSGFL